MGAEKQCFQPSVKLGTVPVVGQTGTDNYQACPKHSHMLMVQTQSKLCHPLLPKGLTGAKCIAQINIAGIKCNCLLDTGSQVTTISQSFYNENLSEQHIHSLNNLLEVESANGQSVPYLGYVEVTITFPKDFVGVDIEVPTLALIVPDFSPNSQPSVLAQIRWMCCTRISLRCKPATYLPH